jgi:hypothetical protein
MKPGDTETGSVTVTNRGGQSARLFLQSSAPDGALGDVLRVTVDGVGEGRLTELAGCHDLGSLPAGAARTYRFSARWPATAADNAYAGASTTVDHRWVLGDSPCAPGSASEPRLAISHRRVALVGGRAQLQLRCASRVACAGAIRLRPRAGLRSRLGTAAGVTRARFGIAAGRRGMVSLPLPAASRPALRRQHKAIALVVVDLEGGGRTARLITVIRH